MLSLAYGNWFADVNLARSIAWKYLVLASSIMVATRSSGLTFCFGFHGHIFLIIFKLLEACEFGGRRILRNFLKEKNLSVSRALTISDAGDPLDVQIDGNTPSC